jgi:hypothetical protein
MELIKADIQDQVLFSLLSKMFKIKTQNVHKEVVVQDNILLPLLLNIYFTPLDKYSKTLSKTYNVNKKFKRNPKYYRLTFLTKEEKFKLFSGKAELKLKQLKKVYKGIPKDLCEANRVSDCIFDSVRKFHI